jgi:hypothetical protein
VPLENTPPTDPAGGELAVGSTGDLYYIPSGDIPTCHLFGLFTLISIIFIVVVKACPMAAA